MEKNKDSLPIGCKYGFPGVPHLLAATVCPGIEQNSRNFPRWFAKHLPWLSGPHSEGKYKDNHPPVLGGTEGAWHVSPSSADTVRPVTVMLWEERARPPHDLRGPTLLAPNHALQLALSPFCYTLPRTCSVGSLLFRSHPQHFPTSETQPPWETDNLRNCQFLKNPVTRNLSPLAQDSSAFMCLPFFAGSPLPHPHYPQSAVEMLHLPRRLVLILSWNETVWEAHITYSTFHDAMKPLCPYYSDPNTGPISKSQAPWDHKQNLLWTDVSSSKHGANYIVDTSARNMAYLWSLWIPECSTKDIRYCGQVPPKLQWICQYGHDQTAFFIYNHGL